MLQGENMNRKVLLFAGALFLLFALKYALGQENDVSGWDSETYEDPAESIFGLMMAAPLFGMVIGAVRVLVQRSVRPIVEPIRLN